MAHIETMFFKQEKPDHPDVAGSNKGKLLMIVTGLSDPSIILF